MKWILFLILLPVSAWSQEIKVMTWNTYLIPPPWNNTKQADRTEVMAEKLPSMEHDVMFFQEAFYDKKRNDLIKATKVSHPYSAIPKKGKKIKQIQDSGLFVVSKHPMEIVDQVIFKDCDNADCLSSKTALMVEVTLPGGKKVQMINTHMQASEQPKSIAIRKKQFEEIKAMMAKHQKPGVAQILLGDLNVNGNDGNEYGESLKLMEMDSTPLDGDVKGTNGFDTGECFKKTGDGKEEWLDHIWVKNNKSDVKVKSKRVLKMMGNLNDCDCPLSDHHAVEAVIKF